MLSFWYYHRCIIIHLLLYYSNNCVIQASYDRDGRYSYSLTTFDPSGKLGQVERAIAASQRGTPIVTMIYNNTNTNEYGIIMAAPQVLPNLLTFDDGTSRFTLITSNIMITHSGLSSDGRILVSAAQKLAIQHEYTFDETIPIHILLEELSLLYQEYTMKVATRPFGTTLIVAHVPEYSSIYKQNQQSATYRIDPSGNVELVEEYAIIHGGQLEKTDLLSNLNVLMNTTNFETIEDCQEKVVQLLRDALKQQRSKSKNSNDDRYQDVTILTANLYRNGNANPNEGTFRKERHEPEYKLTER
jgi:20S proteasome subunit alpha 2